MLIDERGADAAAAIHAYTDGLAVPDTRRLVRRGARRRATGRAGLALVALVAVVGVALQAGGSDGPGVVAADTASGRTAHATWRAIVKDSAGLAGAKVRATGTAGDGTLLAAGSDVSTGAEQAALWWSPTGTEWHRAEEPSRAGAITAVAADGDVVLAVGERHDRTGDTSRSFVWRSTDGGRHWTELAADGGPFGPARPDMGRPAFDGLLAHDGVWVAFGGGSSGYGAIWASRDGVSWFEALGTNPVGSAGVVERGDGSLLAYGHGPQGMLAWTTTDPFDWGRPQPMVTPSGTYLERVAPGATLALAADLERHTPWTIVRSTDGGLTWTSDAALPGPGPEARIATLGVVGGRLVVSGTADSSERPGAWLAAGDGTWEPIPAELQEAATGQLDVLLAGEHRAVVFAATTRIPRFYVVDIDAG